MDETVKKKIFGIIQKDVSVDPASLDPDADLRDQVSLDSMQFVTLIARLEKELCIEIPISAMESRSLNDFLSVLEKELVRGAAA